MKFEKIDLFEGIPDEEVMRMVVCFGAKIKDFKEGELICDYSDTGDDVGVMLKGSASMMRTDEDGEVAVMELFGEGDIFGEALAFSNEASRADTAFRERYKESRRTCGRSRRTLL